MLCKSKKFVFFALVDFSSQFQSAIHIDAATFHLNQIMFLLQRCHWKLQALRSSSLACILAKASMRDSV